jgi:hypothetical protein
MEEKPPLPLIEKRRGAKPFLPLMLLRVLRLLIGINIRWKKQKHWMVPMLFCEK